jgi:chromosome segregation ATPase
MTTEEILQLLLSKIDTNHKEVTEKIDITIADIKDMKTDIAEIKSDIQYLKKNDEIDSISINGAYNVIKEVDTKLDKLVGEINHQRRFMQKAVGDLSADCNSLEERIEKLEQDKKAS